MARAETNDKIKLRKILRPPDLSTGQNFGSAKIFQVLVISDHVNRSRRTFKVMLPCFESCKYCQKFFVMSVIVDFRGGETSGVKCYWVNFARIKIGRAHV